MAVQLCTFADHTIRSHKYWMENISHVRYLQLRDHRLFFLRYERGMFRALTIQPWINSNNTSLDRRKELGRDGRGLFPG